jgi:hypothetical protein
MQHQPPEILDVVPAPPGLTCRLYGSASEDVHNCQREAQYVYVYDKNADPDGPLVPTNGIACAECFGVPDRFQERAAGFTDHGYLPTAARSIAVAIELDGDRSVFHAYDTPCMDRPVQSDPNRITPWCAVTKTTPELLASTDMDACMGCLKANPTGLRDVWATVKYLRSRGLVEPDQGDGDE